MIAGILLNNESDDFKYDLLSSHIRRYVSFGELMGICLKRVVFSISNKR